MYWLVSFTDYPLKDAVIALPPNPHCLSISRLVSRLYIEETQLAFIHTKVVYGSPCCWDLHWVRCVRLHMKNRMSTLNRLTKRGDNFLVLLWQESSCYKLLSYPITSCSLFGFSSFFFLICFYTFSSLLFPQSFSLSSFLTVPLPFHSPHLFCLPMLRLNNKTTTR